MPLRCKHCIGKLNKNITQYFKCFFLLLKKKKSTIRSLVAALLSNRCDQ